MVLWVDLACATLLLVSTLYVLHVEGCFTHDLLVAAWAAGLCLTEFIMQFNISAAFLSHGNGFADI